MIKKFLTAAIVVFSVAAFLFGVPVFADYDDITFNIVSRDVTATVPGSSTSVRPSSISVDGSDISLVFPAISGGSYDYLAINIYFSVTVYCKNISFRVNQMPYDSVGTLGQTTTYTSIYLRDITDHNLNDSLVRRNNFNLTNSFDYYYSFDDPTDIGSLRFLYYARNESMGFFNHSFKIVISDLKINDQNNIIIEGLSDVNNTLKDTNEKVDQILNADTTKHFDPDFELPDVEMPELEPLDPSILIALDENPYTYSLSLFDSICRSQAWTQVFIILCGTACVLPVIIKLAKRA